MKIVFAALVALLVTAGCAGANPAATPAGAPSSAVPSAEPSQAPPPATDLPSVPVSPTKGGGKPTASGTQTVFGLVSAGVEPNCVILTSPSMSYLLIFADPALKAKAANGTEVVVTGKADPGQMTTCQQGTPFLVTAIRPA
ncbi:hypothetical protein AB0M20_22710 [Actinoplanes sp. NPDC051633]|uniref:hypothetical protein n=1 Tax=Actinoplanes sp. NPDC051633 TaxID=3155670 RepID=UPI003425C3FE